jgi:DNA-binding NtrC family response regulator
MALTELMGESPPMRALRSRIERVASTPLPVLITGATGTGKEVVARAIHERSGRRGPFVPVDCGAITSTLVETELFGHERGAFTGANTRKEGLVYAARGGTFFLDEVGELPLEAQTRLLRLLEGNTYRPVGSLDERTADIRVVAATWRDLERSVEEGRFRRDLFHRLAIVDLRLPALKDRGDDIVVLFTAFVEEACRRQRRVSPVLDSSVRALLERWEWPGNVRELKNLAQYVAALAGGRIHLQDLPPAYRGSLPERSVAAVGGGASVAIRTELPYLEARRVWLDEFQIRYVEAQLAAHGGNVSAAARAAGMDRRSIQRVISRLRPLPEAGHGDPE